VDFRLNAALGVAAAKVFFHKAIKGCQASGPRTVTLDGYATSHRAVREMKVELPVDTKVRSSTYLNNLLEQDRRDVKLRIGPMLGFKQFGTAWSRSLALNCSVESTRDSSTSGATPQRENAPGVWNGDTIKLTSSHPQLGPPFLPCHLRQIPQAAGIIHRTAHPWRRCWRANNWIW
jgi:hypothetical protein